MQALHPLIQKIIEQNEAVLPEGFDSWALKSTRADLTTFGLYQWPQPGGVAECDPAEIVVGSDDPCPSAYGDGLCVGLNWGAMASGGFPARTLLLVAYATKDILGQGSGKVRVSKAAVVAIVDGERLLDEHSKMQDLTGASLEDCVGRGTGLDDAGLARKRDLLAQAVARAALPADADPMNVLAEFGGFEIVMMAGAMLGAAERGMTLLIDGFIVTSALLAALRIAPSIREYCVFCHRSAEPGHLAQLQDLQAEPLIDLGLRLGEGTGAALAWPLVSAAVAFLNEMASFASAGVSEKG